MGNLPNSRDNTKPVGFTRYASKRIIIVIAAMAVVVWAFSAIPESGGRGEMHAKGRSGKNVHLAGALVASTDSGAEDSAEGKTHTEAETEPDTEIIKPDTPDHSIASDDAKPSEASSTEDHASEADSQEAVEEKDHGADTDAHQPSEEDHGSTAPHEASHENLPTGVAFVNAAIAPLDYELNERFWGWRPNDIINITDNRNNFQLGVLEVTRRTVVSLAERIARTGTADAFNPHLENSMNWLMVKATKYWFPSAESKYIESMDELKKYRDALSNGNGSFYTRADNLIPLLSSYEDLLGSCDENLAKQKNRDGSKVSLFKADDYFYYAKGVANSIAIVLEAVHHDFKETLESRHATELLHHALESCRQAAALSPLLITNGKLDDILANHRANMAAPISHARFYIGQLVKTLST